MRLGELIRERRRAANLSQEELAERVGTHPKTIGKWERGVAVPRGKAIAALEEALGMRLVNRAPAVRVRAVDPAELTTSELTAALISYAAELSRRVPSDLATRSLVDASTISDEGWTATRATDIAQSNEELS